MKVFTSMKPSFRLLPLQSAPCIAALGAALDVHFDDNGYLGIIFTNFMWLFGVESILNDQIDRDLCFFQFFWLENTDAISSNNMSRLLLEAYFRQKKSTKCVIASAHLSSFEKLLWWTEEK